MENNGQTCESCSDATSDVRKAPVDQDQTNSELKKRLCHISNKIVVMSGKGGVGKSSTAVNLALALAMQGLAVGLLDVDFHGPSVPKMLGAEDERPRVSEQGLTPVNVQGMKIMSLGFMLESRDDAVIWRGAMKHGVILQMLGEVDWGYLDYLVVDCPPGTGDEPLSVLQTLGENTKAVIVTTPQDVAVLDVRKSINFCRQLNVDILGIIENMSGFVCSGCGQVHHIFKQGGGVKLAEETGLSFLGAIPLDPVFAEAGDDGRPCLISHPETAISKSFVKIGHAVSGR